MLVLDRRVGETIVIDGDIRLELLETRRGGAKLGIICDRRQHTVERAENLGATPRVLVQPVELAITDRNYTAAEVREIVSKFMRDFRLSANRRWL